ncbi:MAG TPA: GNAT family N-acetyltransferase [Propionibacteriaceae bacterium]|nr:GNAT family N-acetyltransferase [Propionibacteriaceae bacterium]
MKLMADAKPPPLATARSFPDRVPILTDADAGVTLRAPGRGDLPGMVEQSRDPEMIRWTSVPTPEGGYQLRDAEEFLALINAGWTSGERLGWTIEAQRGSERGFCGSIDLHLEGGGVADVGFGLHPQARGRSIMTAALQLVCNYGFEVAGLQVIRWRAVVGNWASRRVVANVGFIFDGTVRRLLVRRGVLLDGWIATLTPEDPRVPQPWLHPVELEGGGIRLRPFRASDVDRIVEACSDPRTAHWLVSMPRPYQRHHALAYLDSLGELAARGIGVTWCLADPKDDRCLGSISLDGLNTYAKRGEIGYWAHPDARGRDIVTDAVRLVTRHANETGLARSLIIRCARGNTASRRVAERAGYTKVGIQPASEPLGDGELADLVLYSCP